MQSVNYEVEYTVSEVGAGEITESNAIEKGLYLYHELIERHLNRGYMCNLLHAICCRGAKITVQLL